MTSPPVPVSRESMRILRAQKEEERRIQQIEREVANIYRYAIHAAEHTTESRYLHPFNIHTHISSDFYKTNMAEILSGVQSLFPDCSVEHTTLKMATTRDGKTYDISKIDAALMPFIMNVQPSADYIVVDWS